MTETQINLSLFFWGGGGSLKLLRECSHGLTCLLFRIRIVRWVCAYKSLTSLYILTLQLESTRTFVDEVSAAIVSARGRVVDFDALDLEIWED